MHAKSSGTLVIYFCLFSAMCLDVAPWSNEVAIIMPNWTLLTLMYWSIALPHKISVGTGWVTGLLFDVLVGSIIGQNALIFSITTYFSHTLYSRLRNYHVWQQAIFILIFFLLMQLISLLISQLNDHLSISYLLLIPAITSAISWPIIFATLRLTRRRFRIQ
jgi:rod shape-determining protein MreD